MKELFEKIKAFTKQMFNYIMLVTGMILCFTVGYYYNTLKELSKAGKPETILKKDITIAIDESSNFMIIRKSNGNYTVFEDSIGRTIFSIYAKNLWGQHNAPEQK
jgi:cellobiose-specific phosphotransferase system component IIC